MEYVWIKNTPQLEKRRHGTVCEKIVEDLLLKNLPSKYYTRVNTTNGIDIKLMNGCIRHIEVKSAMEREWEGQSRTRTGRFVIKKQDYLDADLFIFVVKKVDYNLNWVEPQVRIKIVETRDLINFLREKKKLPLTKQYKLTITNMDKLKHLNSVKEVVHSRLSQCQFIKKDQTQCRNPVGKRKSRYCTLHSKQ